MGQIFRITGIQLFKNRVELTDATGKRMLWTLPETSNVRSFKVGRRLAIHNGTATILR